MTTVKNREEKLAVNPELEAERLTATFDVVELTTLVDVGEGNTSDRHYIEKIFKDDLNLPDAFAMLNKNPDEIFHSAFDTAKYVEEKLKNYSLPGQMLGYNQFVHSIHIRSIAFPAENPTVLAQLMFMPTILGQGTLEQQERWQPLLKQRKMFGTYAQTELGHGTNMRGLETTATYEPETEEFILHSPTITSIKCWPGGLGRACNFAVVMAQLYTKGECHGLHPFMVQLRNLEDHSPLPGITLGELGPKMGLQATDNGFLRFNHVRIPRDNMLMRYAKVLKDGTYVKPVLKRTSYGTLILMRVGVVQTSALNLAQACTIAVRYNGVRRQGNIEPDKPEVKIIDYQTQQYRLFTQVALSFGMLFTFQRLCLFYFESVADGSGDRLIELHSISSGMKALSSHTCSVGVEICRQTCGGLGYLQASRFPALYGAVVAACTYDGDNTVLMLQTARYLMKSLKMINEGNEVSSTVKYLKEVQRQSDETSPMAKFVYMFELTSAGITKVVGKQLESEIANGTKLELAWNNNAVNLVRCANFHMQVYVMRSLHEFFCTTDMTDALHTVLAQLCELLGLYWVLQQSGEFIVYGGFSKQHIDDLNLRVPKLLQALRPNIVSLVDAFDFCDAALHSIIGCYDGWVYERIYDYWAQLPANKQKEVPHSTQLKANL